jgi:glycosyltransferase involved in cell wall biosynthesis
VLSQGTWLAKQLNCPFILTLHDFLQPREKFRFDPRLGKRVIAVSDAVQSGLLAKSAIAAELVSVIHSGVEADVNSEVEPIFEPGRVPVVGTASPLEQVKGLPFFLKAASQVLKAGFDVEFLVSGAGPEEANLRQLAEKLGIQRLVTFVPNMFDFATSLAAMDIFCLPSLQQGLGTIMLDAMSLGRPVIATKVGGVEGVVQDNHTGLIVAPSDSNALALRIIELLKDPVRARNIGKAAREMVIRQYGVETMVRKTANLYREVIESTQ